MVSKSEAEITHLYRDRVQRGFASGSIDSTRVPLRRANDTANMSAALNLEHGPNGLGEGPQITEEVRGGRGQSVGRMGCATARREGSSERQAARAGAMGG